MMQLRFLFLLLVLPIMGMGAIPVVGKVTAVMDDQQALQVLIVRSGDSDLRSGETVIFGVGPGDYKIGYLKRGIRGNASSFEAEWSLGQIFPASGEGISEMRQMNQGFLQAMELRSQGDYLKVGDPVLDFAMLNQNGHVRQIRDLRGRNFVLNFIFTRCGIPEMCPASSTRMAEMQERAREEGLDDLSFVTISFDPAFDSPGILRGYGEAYGMEFENFDLLTGSQELIDSLLRLFGILTIEEDGTINHTIATVLVDKEGRIALRQEGRNWKIEPFLKALSKSN